MLRGNSRSLRGEGAACIGGSGRSGGTTTREFRASRSEGSAASVLAESFAVLRVSLPSTLQIYLIPIFHLVHTITALHGRPSRVRAVNSPGTKDSVYTSTAPISIPCTKFS